MMWFQLWVLAMKHGLWRDPKAMLRTLGQTIYIVVVWDGKFH